MGARFLQGHASREIFRAYAYARPDHRRHSQAGRPRRGNCARRAVASAATAGAGQADGRRKEPARPDPAESRRMALARKPAAARRDGARVAATDERRRQRGGRPRERYDGHWRSASAGDERRARFPRSGGLAPAVATGGRATPSSPGDAALAATTPAGEAQGAGADVKGMPVVSFKFRGIRQEERKTITLEYNRSEAMQRSYAPQGFVGLLAADLDLRAGGHFVEVDLDDPFFREFEATASAPVDFARIGLNAAELALSYGRSDDPGGPKHHDLRFSATDKDDKSWKVFTNAAGDLLYHVTTHTTSIPCPDGTGLKQQRLRSDRNRRSQSVAQSIRKPWIYRGADRRQSRRLGRD